MNYFRMRIDDKEKILEKFTQFLKEKDVEIQLLCHETPNDENPHFHALAAGKCSLEALRKARSRYFKDDEEMKGNGVASISNCDRLEEYKEYLCKGAKVVKNKQTLKYENRSDVVMKVNTIGLDVEKYQDDFWYRHSMDQPKQYRSYKKGPTLSERVLTDWSLYWEVEYECKEDDIFAVNRYYASDIVRNAEFKNEKPLERLWTKWDVSPEVLDIYYGGKRSDVFVLERNVLKRQFKQFDVKHAVIEWLMDWFTSKNKPWDEYMIIRYTNLIFWKFKHHFMCYTGSRVDQVNRIATKLAVEGDLTFD